MVALQDLIIEPMGGDLLVWRCLHSGPLSADSIDHPSPNPEVDWPSTRQRNVPLLRKLVEVYGSCAIIARDGNEIVATLRFYPKALYALSGGEGFCLQQRYPFGPAEDLVSQRFPPLSELADKTLVVHCMMIAAPHGDPGRYRRKGLATRMVQELIRWATQRGWEAIEATAYEDIPLLYAISGAAGKSFWHKLGFQIIKQDTERAIEGALLERVCVDAEKAGVPPERAAAKYLMRLQLPR